MVAADSIAQDRTPLESGPRTGGGRHGRVHGVVESGGKVDRSHAGRVVAAIPAFNEERTIGSLVLGARQWVDEVLVVDDGSEDNTARIATLAGARVVSHGANRGYGAAIASCLDYARAEGATALVILDGDGQHDPSQIPDVLAPVLNREADISIGSRFDESAPASDVPGYRKFGISFLTKLSRIGVPGDSQVEDGQSGFRAYSAEAIDVIRPAEMGMGVSAEILLDAGKHSLRLREVPIECRYDVDGSTEGPVKHGASVVSSILRYVETEHALLTFAVPGLIAFVLGLVLGGLILNDFTAGLRIQVPVLVACVLLLVGGLTLGSTGLILHAVMNATKRWRADDTPRR